MRFITINNRAHAKLKLISSTVVETLRPRKKDTKYTPLSLRQEKPYAILWLIKRYPEELSNSQIAKLRLVPKREP